MKLTRKQRRILDLTSKVRDEIFNGEFDDDTTYLAVVKLFPTVEPGFKPRDLGYTSYKALANDLAELIEALPDDDDDDDDGGIVGEFKKNPIKTTVSGISLLGKIGGLLGL